MSYLVEEGSSIRSVIVTYSFKEMLIRKYVVIKSHASKGF